MSSSGRTTYDHVEVTITMALDLLWPYRAPFIKILPYKGFLVGPYYSKFST